MIKPYKLYGRSETDALTQRLLALFYEWKSTWFMSAADAGGISVEISSEPDNFSDFKQPICYFCTINGHAVEIVAETRVIGELLNRLINTKTNTLSAKLSPVSSAVVEKCLLSLVRILTSQLAAKVEVTALMESSEMSELTLRQGTMFVSINIGASPLVVVIPYDLLKQYVDKNDADVKQPVTALSKRKDCKIYECAQLSLLVGSTELDYDTVSNLRVGDVITLDSKIDEPLTVTLSDGSKVCNAFIGKQNDKKVAKIILDKQV